MRTETIQPGEGLSSFVKTILVIDQPLDHGPVSLPFFADGSPGIMYLQSQQPVFINSPGVTADRLLLYGQTVKPVSFLATGAYRAIIFCLHPQAIRWLFGIPVAELTDTCLNLERLLFKRSGLADRLQNTPGASEQVKLIAGLLHQLAISKPFKTDATVDAAIAQITASKGTKPIKTIRSQLQLSERTLERRFENNVGVSPKLFARIIQFHHSFSQLTAGNYALLSDVAYENGYADQSHFIRAVREFTGSSPLALRDLHLPV